MKTLKPRVTNLLKPRIAAPAGVERIRGSALVKIRREHFKAFPLCVECEKAGYISPAQQLDHITPIWAEGQETASNRQGLCKACHAAKTALEAAMRAGKAG